MESKALIPDLPDPRGFRILVKMPSMEEKTAGGIIIPDSTKKLEESASVMGLVVAMGADAYKDPSRFPSGPWCEIGDCVIIRSYSGTRFKVDGQEYRLINDDSVEAVTTRPVERA